MKVKLDENLPLRIAIELRARSHDVRTVGEEGLTGRADADIWQTSQHEGRILITQDKTATIAVGVLLILLQYKANPKPR
jgi:predicted nuclease of predicted toxin-antitoxin system